MRLFFFMLAILGLSACAQLMNGQQQPVRSLKTNLYATSCSGAVETWASCNQKAIKTCGGRYVELDKSESIVGGRRELTFQCDK